jgi:hypothetical protein
MQISKLAPLTRLFAVPATPWAVKMVETGDTTGLTVRAGYMNIISQPPVSGALAATI